MATFFQLELRIVPCTTCGAPLEGLRAGGSVACRYCHSTERITPREDTPLVVGPRLSEADRLAHLRREDAVAAPTPPALRELVFGDRLAPWQVSEALARWQVALREHDSVVLFALTRALSAHYERARSFLEERAIVEGALDELSEPRQRQVLRAILARSAALSGDLGAAHAWLASCDPTAVDLLADGTYRYAAACLETVRGNFPRVLELLGQSAADVPLPNELDPVAEVLRANAWERLGHRDRAALALVHLAEHGGPLFHLRARELIELHPGLQLCSQSTDAAEPRIQAIFRAKATARSFGSMSGIIIAGVLVLLGCAGVIAASMLGDVYDLGFGMHPITYLVVTFVAMVGFILGILGINDARSRRREQKLRETGRLVPGVVVHRVATGNATLGVLEVMVRVLVLDGATGYLASTVSYFRDPDSPEFARGKMVALRVDADDPHAFALVL